MIIFGYNGQLALFSFIIYLICLVRYRKSVCITTTTNYIKEYIFLLLWLLISSVFAFAEHDTYHYWNGFNEVKAGWGYFEKVYYFLASLTSSYWIWRLMIWGTSSLLILFTSFRLKIRPETLGLVMTMFFISQFTITRGALAFSLCTFGLTVLMSIPQDSSVFKKTLLFSISVVIIYLSTKCHRSMMLFILFIPIAICFPLNKKTIYFSILLFPLLYFLIKYLLPLIISSGFLSESMAELVEDYSNQEGINLSLNGVIRTYIEHLGWIFIIYPLALFAIKDYTNKAITFFIKYAFVLIYFGSLLFKQPLGPFMSTRTLHAASFPLLFSASYFLQYHKPTKLMKLGMACFFISTIVYHFYINITYWW